MKINRTKRAQKHLQFYSNNFGFREPYQILLDGTFCFQAVKHNIQIAQQIQKYLQAQIKLVTTACVIIETESLGSQLGTAKILKEFKVHKCGHEKSPISGSECLKHQCKQSHYVVATQDRQLQDELRRKVGVPLLYLHNAAPTLEKPSNESYRVVNKRTKVSGLSQTDVLRLKQLKECEGLVRNQVGEKVGKRKKKGGPNPLSCKKKKVKVQKGETQPVTKVKAGQVEKKRKHKKLPKHVKEILKAEINKASS